MKGLILIRLIWACDVTSTFFTPPSPNPMNIQYTLYLPIIKWNNLDFQLNILQKV